MLGEPVAAAVTSWGSGSDFVAKLTTYQSFEGIAFDAKGDTFDASFFGGAANFTASGASLLGVDFSLEAQPVAFQDGYNGALTFATGDVLNITGWTMNISRPLYPGTPLGQQWIKYRPGLVTITGTIEGNFDGTVMPSRPLISTGWGSATFTVVSGGTGKQLAGSINYTQTSANLKRGANATKQYNYKASGALTTVGSATNCLWAADASGSILSGIEIDKALVLTTNTAMTLSGAAYWKSIAITNKTGSPVTVKVDGSFSDTVTGLA
jgi:hypothetical protein